MNILMYILDCPDNITKDLQGILNVVGDIIQLFKIAVPILLIVLGMFDFFKAVSAGKEDDIKKAQGMFIKRVIYGVVIFLIITIVMLLMGIISDHYESPASGIPTPLDWMGCIPGVG